MKYIPMEIFIKKIYSLKEHFSICFFFILFLSSQQVKSCMCKKSICIERNISKATHVIYGEVVRIDEKEYSHSHIKTMKVKVSKKYKGVPVYDTITIYGQDGINCLEYLDNFKLGDRYLFTLFSTRDNDSTLPYLIKFGLSGCGKHYYNIDTPTITGIIHIKTFENYQRKTRRITKRIETLQNRHFNKNNEKAEIKISNLREKVSNIQEKYKEQMVISDFISWLEEITKT